MSHKHSKFKVIESSDGRKLWSSVAWLPDTSHPKIIFWSIGNQLDLPNGQSGQESFGANK